MTTQLKTVNHKEELGISLAQRDARAQEISKITAQVESYQRDAKTALAKVLLLHQAQEIENRIISLLNYLAQYPSDDKSALLVAERESQKTILKTLEESR